MEFGVLLVLRHSRGHGSESIDHNGAADHHWSQEPQLVLGKNEGKEAKVSCMGGQSVGEVLEEEKGGRCRGKKKEGGKQFFGL